MKFYQPGGGGGGGLMGREATLQTNNNFILDQADSIIFLSGGGADLPKFSTSKTITNAQTKTETKAANLQNLNMLGEGGTPS